MDRITFPLGWLLVLDLYKEVYVQILNMCPFSQCGGYTRFDCASYTELFSCCLVILYFSFLWHIAEFICVFLSFHMRFETSYLSENEINEASGTYQYLVRLNINYFPVLLQLTDQSHGLFVKSTPLNFF